MDITYKLFFAIFIYLLTVYFLGSKVYFWALKLYSKIRLKSLGLELDDLEFSFEQIDYLVSTPSANFSEGFAEKNNFFIRSLRKSIIWPEIYALKVVAQVANKDNNFKQNYEEIEIAFLDKNRFPVPILDTLKYYDEISDYDYRLLVSYLFSHPQTHNLIVKEVRKRVVKG